MFGLGTKEIVIIAIVMLLLFGSKRIPELAKDLVSAIKNLTNAFNKNGEEDSKKKK